MTDSWKRLGKELSEPLPVFNFPSGQFGIREVEFPRDTGLSAFVATDGGYVYPCSKVASPNIPRRLDRFVFPDTMEDFLQYSTWIEWGKE